MLRNWKVWAGAIAAGALIVKAPTPVGHATGMAISLVFNAIVAFLSALPAFLGALGHAHG